MEEIISVALGITVGVAVLLEVVKNIFKERINVDFYPLVAMILGVLIALGTTLVPEIDYGVSKPALMVAGALAGLSSSGFYDLTVKPMKKDK